MILINNYSDVLKFKWKTIDSPNENSKFIVPENDNLKNSLGQLFLIATFDNAKIADHIVNLHNLFT